jgi:DNA-binding CsgD family transcriptional regulator
MLGLPSDEVWAALSQLGELDLLLPGPGSGFQPVSPDIAIIRLLDLARDLLLGNARHLQSLRSVLDTISKGHGSFPANVGHQVRVRPLTDELSLSSALHGVPVRAHTEVVSMHPGNPLSTRSLATSVEHNRQVLDKGVTLRIIHSDAMVRVPSGKEHVQALQEAGAEVRLSTLLPFPLILVDNELAYVAAAPQDEQMGALEIRGPEVCRVLRATFDYCWTTAAAPQALAAATRDASFSRRELVILDMLAIGMKDETMARAMGISSRTLRRVMRNLMDKLGAESRFQAGMRMAALGLIGKLQA